MPTSADSKKSIAQMEQDLKRLAAKIDREKEKERHRVLDEIALMAIEHKFTADEIAEAIAAAPKKQTHSAATQYQNPDTGEIWPGKGKKPKWLQEKIAGGAKLEDFALKPEPSANMDMSKISPP